jgi:hypothetical protein
MPLRECQKKCRVCALPMKHENLINEEFSEKGMDARTVAKWANEEFNLDLSHLELFEHVQHRHLEYRLGR